MRGVVWIIECKYHKRGRNWRPSVDHIPFTSEEGAKKTAARRQQENPGWEYRAIPYCPLSRSSL